MSKQYEYKEMIIVESRLIYSLNAQGEKGWGAFYISPKVSQESVKVVMMREKPYSRCQETGQLREEERGL